MKKGKRETNRDQRLVEAGRFRMKTFPEFASIRCIAFCNSRAAVHMASPIPETRKRTDVELHQIVKEEADELQAYTKQNQKQHPKRKE